MTDITMTVFGEKVFEPEYEEFRSSSKSKLAALGACMLFAKFMRDHGYDSISAEDVYNNTSPLRGDNRLDFLESYRIYADNGKEVEFAYMYIINTNVVWATLYDPEIDDYIGDMEIHE